VASFLEQAVFTIKSVSNDWPTDHSSVLFIYILSRGKSYVLFDRSYPVSGVARICCEEGQCWKLCHGAGGTHGGLQGPVQQLLDD